MAGMSVWGSGIGARVNGVKGRGSSEMGDVSVVSAAAEAASTTMIAGAAALVVVVVVGEGCVAGAAPDGAVSVSGLCCSGLGSERSADVGRTGVSDCACGTVVGGVMIGTAVLGCSSSALGAGMGADIGSKLNGLLCSLGGGSGERGDMAWSFGSAGLRVGEGVISGVRVSTALVGIGGAGR
jgi:hypothetical protein